MKNLYQHIERVKEKINFKYPCTAIKQPCLVPEKCDNCNCEDLLLIQKMIKLIKTFGVA